MPNLATWIREKDQTWFRPILGRFSQINFWNAATGQISVAGMHGLLLTGGSDISVQYLKQEVVDPSVLEKDVDPVRDEWEFAAVENALSRGLPILAICRGIQVLNVALGGSLKLDIPGHREEEQKDQNVQPLRTAASAEHRFVRVNSAHHQAIDRLGNGLEIEAWSASDDIIEQVRLRHRPFVLGVQYHPERDAAYYASLFEDFFSRLTSSM